MHNILRMRTQSHVCENPISSFVNVYIDPGNPGKPQGLPHTLLFFQMLALVFTDNGDMQCLCLVIQIGPCVIHPLP